MDPRLFSPRSPGRLVDATDALGRRGKAFVPSPLPPVMELGGRELRLALSAADQELARLDALAQQIDRPDLLFGIHLRREAVLSSAIEGTHTSLADLARYEATRRQQSDDDPTVENYVRALKFGLTRVQEIPVGNRLFCELHEILMEHSDHRRTTPGRVRDCIVFIGEGTFEGARFVPPPDIFVGELVDNLTDYLVNENEAALVKLAIAHYQFEAIHPFRDGNGRIGRLLISLWLNREGILRSPTLFLSAFFEKNKQQYYDALLRVSTDGDWAVWIGFFLRAVATQSRDANIRTQHLLALREQYKRRLAGPRATMGPSHLVDALFDIPVVTVPGVAKLLGVTYAAAKSTIQKLVTAGILTGPDREATGVGFYYAGELIDAIERDL
jgi:Fic family protein